MKSSLIFHFGAREGKGRREVKEPQIKLYNLKDKRSVCLSLASHNDSLSKRKRREEEKGGGEGRCQSESQTASI